MFAANDPPLPSTWGQPCTEVRAVYAKRFFCTFARVDRPAPAVGRRGIPHIDFCKGIGMRNNEQFVSPMVRVVLSGAVVDWATYHFGRPVRFPARSVENALLRTLAEHYCRRRLEGPAPGENVTGRWEHWADVALPSTRWQRGPGRVHLTQQGMLLLKAHINTLFNAHLWCDALRVIGKTNGLNAWVNGWCVDNGIREGYRESVRQRLYRMRKEYEGCGVRLLV